MAILVDLFAFLALLAPFLWVSTGKGLHPSAALGAALMWVVGGIVGTAVAMAAGLDPEGVGIGGRVVFAIAGGLWLWTRLDVLPSRAGEGGEQVCVYRAPGPVDPEVVATFLTNAGVAAIGEPWAVWVPKTDVVAVRRILPGFLAMTCVYRGNSVADAHMAANWIRRNGLEVQVRGDHRSSVIGAIPVMDAYPEVWVRGVDEDRARGLLAQIEPEESDDSPAWTCVQCGEENPPAFGSCWSCGRAPE